jgi:peptide/nickel transport system substrate-binding protein
VTGLTWSDFVQNSLDHNLPIFFAGWWEDIHDPHNWVVPYTTGSWGLCQKLPADLKVQFAKIINRAVSESDPARRAMIYKEFNQLYYDTASSIPLFMSTGERYQQRWVKGWYHNPMYSGRYFYALWKE